MKKAGLNKIFSSIGIKYKDTENVYTLFPKDKKQEEIIQAILSKIDLHLLESTRQYHFFVEPIPE
jgi:hypothetical protein